MSESFLDLETWPEGIAAARIPANNNVRLLQAIKINPAISATTAAQPGSPDEGDVYILPAAPSGAQWSGFNEADVVIYYEATWTAYTPVDGLRKFVIDEGEDWQYIGGSSGAWAPAGGGSGGVVGPPSSVDNTLPRYDGTTGKLLQGSGVLVSDADEISGYKGKINRQTGTSYTLVTADSGKIVELANAASIALTADPSLPEGFCCTIVQALAGVVTIASSGSGTVVNRQSQFKTAGVNAMCSVYVRSNSGSNATFVFGGDTAA